MDQLAVTALLSAGLALLAGWLTRWLLNQFKIGQRRRGLAVPPGFDPDTLPFDALTPADFTASVDQGNFGEGLTYVLMGAAGWRPVNGKVGGPQGLDGVFLRAGKRGWEALVIETKTNTSRYDPKSMSRAKILGNLQTLWLTAPDASPLQHAYGAMIADLKASGGRTQTALWRHMLELGETHATPLAPDGSPSGPVVARDNRPVFEGFSLALREFDRSHHYNSRGR
jgi:hypothetical protein